MLKKPKNPVKILDDDPLGNYFCELEVKYSAPDAGNGEFCKEDVRKKFGWSNERTQKVIDTELASGKIRHVGARKTSSGRITEHYAPVDKKKTGEKNGH